MTEALKLYAVQLARPKLCEIQLSRFLLACKDCTTEQQVNEIFKKMFTVKAKK
jgi:hypothetical protein